MQEVTNLGNLWKNTNTNALINPILSSPLLVSLSYKKTHFYFFSDFSNFHAELAQKSLLNGPRPPTSQPSPLLPQPGSNPGMGPNPADLRNIYERNMREMQLNLLRATNPALAAAANLHNPLPNPLSLPALQQRAQLPHGLRPPFSIPQLNPALHSQVTVSSIFSNIHVFVRVFVQLYKFFFRMISQSLLFPVFRSVQIWAKFPAWLAFRRLYKG